MIEKFAILYNLDTKNKIRSWYMEQNKDSHRTISGLVDGKKVTSEWNVCTPKNIGKKNETTPEQQAHDEILALYQKKYDKGWSQNTPNINDTKMFTPMLAAKYEDCKITFPCYSQPKLDGHRCIANKDGLWTRNGKQYKSVPHIWNNIKHLFIQYPDLILDGELYNHTLRNDFNQISSLVKQQKPTPDDLEKSADLVEYHVYDCAGMNRDFSSRNKFLYQLSGNFKFVSTHLHLDQTSLDETYAYYLAGGYEGQMVRLNTPYENKRTKNLIKRKEFLDSEFEIIEVCEGLGNWSGMAKSITLRNTNGTEFSSGIRGTQAEMKQLLLDKEKYPGKFATCRYQNLTPDGVPRFPVITEMDVRDK